MLWLIIIAIAGYVIYKCVKKKMENELVAQVAEELAYSEAMENALKMLTDISHLTTESIFRLDSDPQGYYSGVMSQINVSLSIFHIKSSCGSILHKIERLSEVVQPTPGLDIMKEIRAREDQITDAYEIMKDLLLGGNAPVSDLFIPHLRGGIKFRGNSDTGTMESTIFLKASSQDERQIFLQLLQEKCVEAFLNCKIVSSSATSLTIEFTPNP